MNSIAALLTGCLAAQALAAPAVASACLPEQLSQCPEGSKCVVYEGSDETPFVCMMDNHKAGLVAQKEEARRADFPITQLAVTQEQLTLLNSTDAGVREREATAALTPLLRELFGANSTLVVAEPDDTALELIVPDQTVDGSCSTNVVVRNNRVTARFLESSYLRFTGDIDWGNSASVFAEAGLDASLRVLTDVRVKTGVRVFGSCQKIAQKTVGVDVTSAGQNGIGLNFTAANARVELNERLGLDLVFDMNVDVVSLVIDWDIENIDVSRCDIRILGIRVASVCSLIKRVIQDGIKDFTLGVSTVVAPQLAAKVEEALRTQIGETVRIPLEL